MKKLFAIALLVAALALSGCIQPVPDLSGIGIPQMPSGTGQNSGQEPHGNSLVECPDGSFAVSQNECISSGQQPPANTGIESCGSMDITRLATADDLTKEETDALACFNKKMVDCAEASFGLTGQFGGLFSVTGEQESNCLISYYDNTDGTQKTCVFPKDFLSTAAAAAEEMDQPKLLIMTVAVGMHGVPFTNQLTGETKTIECS